MVSVGKLSAGQARYYLDQAAGPVTAGTALSSGAEDYYLGGPEAAGSWLGHGAQTLGLAGRGGGDGLAPGPGGPAPPAGGLLRPRRAGGGVRPPLPPPQGG